MKEKRSTIKEFYKTYQSSLGKQAARKTTHRGEEKGDNWFPLVLYILMQEFQSISAMVEMPKKKGINTKHNMIWSYKMDWVK